MTEHDAAQPGLAVRLLGDISRVLFVAVIGAAAALKLAIIWGNETVPEGSDSFLYMEYANDLFWGANHLPFRGPGYPLWIALVHSLGIPLRLGTEFLFLGSAAALVAALRLLSIPRLLGLLVFIGIVFHPSTFYELDQPMSEGFFLCIVLLSLSLLFALTTEVRAWRRIIIAVTLGSLCAVLLQTRDNDAALIYSFVAVAVLIALLTARRPILRWRNAIAPLATVATMVAVNLAVLGANQAAFGVSAPNEIVPRAQQVLMNAMMRIDTGEPEIHGFITVTSKARETAYRLSPTLRRYQHDIEVTYKAQHDASAYTTRSRTGVADQFDLQATLIMLDEVVVPWRARNVDKPYQLMQAITPVDVGLEREQLHLQIASEINDALRRGEAKSRPIIYFWNPLSARLYTNAFLSGVRLFAGLFEAKSPPKVDNYPFYGSLYSPLYNKMASRRLDLVQKGPLEGFLAVPAGASVESVSFVNDSVDFFARQGAPNYLGASLDYMALIKMPPYYNMGTVKPTEVRPADAPAGWAASLPPSTRLYRFAIGPVTDRFHLDFGRLVIDYPDGRSANVITPNLQKPMVAADDPETRIYLTRFDLQLSAWQRWAYAVQQGIYDAFNAFAWMLATFAVAISLLNRILLMRAGPAAAPPRPGRLLQPLALGVFLFLILERIGLYALLDVSVVPLNDSRHLFAGNILLAPVTILVCYVIGGFDRFVFGWRARQAGA